MDCKEARRKIDERLQAEREARRQARKTDDGATETTEPSATTSKGDWSELDAHIGQCSKCRADWDTLRRTLGLLDTSCEENPTEEEVETMWQAIQAAGPFGAVLDTPRTSAWARYRPFIAAAISTAAVLAIALRLGEMQFHTIGPPVASIESMSSLKGIATSARIYDVDGDGAASLGLPMLRTEATGESEDLRRRGFWMLSRSAEEPAQLGRPVRRFVVPETQAADKGEIVDFWSEEPPSAGIGVEEKASERISLGYQVPTFGKEVTRGDDVHLGERFVPTAPPPAPAVERYADASGGTLTTIGDHLATWTYDISGGPAGPLPDSGGDEEADEWQAMLNEAYVGYATSNRGRKTTEGSDIVGAGRVELHADGHVAFSRSLGGDTAGASSEADDTYPAAYTPAEELVQKVQAIRDEAELQRSARHVPGAAEEMDFEGEKVGATEASLSDQYFYAGAMAVMRDAQQTDEGRKATTPTTVAGQDVLSAGTTVAGQQVEPSPEQQAQPTIDRPRTSVKIIKTGQLSFEVQEYEAAVENALAVAKRFNSFVADAVSEERSGGALAGRIVFRVVPEQFDALYAALKPLGRLESENANAADVTADYVDLEARIHSMQITEERLQDLAKNKSFMDKISSLLEVEKELTRVRSQIEQMQGQLRVMANRVAWSTITVLLHEPSRTVPSASMSVEVSVLDDASEALGGLMTDLDGRLTSGKTSKRGDGTLQGNYQLSISLARFSDLLGGVASLGRVEERQVTNHQSADEAAPWAERVMCNVALVVFERSRQLPEGEIAVEVAALPDAIEQLDTLLPASGAAVISNHTTRRDDGSSVAALRIRVPCGRFAALIDAVSPLGRTTEQAVSGEVGRIEGGAANVLCELELTMAEPVREVPSGHMVVEVGSFEPALTQLRGIIKDDTVQVLGSSSNQRTDGTWIGEFRLGIKAGALDETVTQLASLGRVAQRQITGIGLGDLSRIDPSAVGVVTLVVGEKQAISPEPDRASRSIRAQLRNGLAGLYASVGLIVAGLIVLAPWAAIALLCAWPISRWYRRRRAAVRAKQTP